MEKKMNNFSRRQFITTTGKSTIMIGGFYLLPSCKQNNNQTSDNSELIEKQVNVWVRLMSDGQVIIYTPAAEMGQGSMTCSIQHYSLLPSSVCFRTRWVKP